MGSRCCTSRPGWPWQCGAYAVSRANLGANASLVAASALLTDYVLTVAVSVAAGVANIVSALPALAPYAVELCLGMIVVLTLMNLRGVKESGTVFAIPTYGFIAVVFAMLLWGGLRVLLGDAPVAESASIGIEPSSQATGLLALLIVLRAFSQGCTALTGVEAVSNGVPNFEPPKPANAAATLALMGAITIAMFAGITVLALVADVRVAVTPEHLIGAPAGYEQKTVIAQEAAAVFGAGSVPFFLVAVFTAAILVLAANTAFNGFPILASILGEDGYLPRQFGRRGDRLVFSNGIALLALLAIALIWAFDASPTRLIQLYIIGVFVSFTLSQWGMVRHWTRLLPTAAAPERARVHRARLINGLGGTLTALVLVIVVIAKFSHGAYIVCIAIPLLFWLMTAIHRHYARVDDQVRPHLGPHPLPSRIHAIVLVSKLHIPTLRALSFARAIRPTTLTAVTVRTSPAHPEQLQYQWDTRGIPVPLVILDSPYRDITGPILDYIAGIRLRSPRDVTWVFLPEYVVEHWWEHLLHNRSALRLKARLRLRPGVLVTTVPWQLGPAPTGPDLRTAEEAALATRHRVRTGPGH